MFELKATRNRFQERVSKETNS